jgi:DNA-binding NarL/FixJ family response regulator
MLTATDDIRVVAEAESVQEAVREASEPDLMSSSWTSASQTAAPAMIEATREIRDRFPNTKVLMLTSFADDEALYASIMAGAPGYVLEQIKGGDLVRGIRSVGAGQSLLDPAITRLVLDRVRRGKQLKDEKLALLSPQEEKILALVAEGLTNNQIGTRLFLAEKTIKNYVSNILGKLEVVRRAEAAAYLARHTSVPGE